MMYLKQWQFWLAVIAVAIIVHFAMGFFMKGSAG